MQEKCGKLKLWFAVASTQLFKTLVALNIA